MPKIWTRIIELKKAVVGIAVALVASVAAVPGVQAEGPPPSQFNLRCSFERETLVQGTPDEAAIHLWSVPAEDLTYKIDTGARRACSGECAVARNIEVAPDGKLLLTSSQTGTGADTTFIYTEVLSADRETLSIQQAAKTATGSMVGSRHVFSCRTYEFNGLPE